MRTTCRAARRRTVFTTPDLSVGEYALSTDGTTIWFTAGEEARTNLFSVPAAGGVPKRVLKGGSIGSIQPARACWSSRCRRWSRRRRSTAPRSDGAGVKPLTRANEGWLKKVAFSQPESLTVNAAGGPVQYWLIKPPNFDPATKYPVVFLIHGGPQGVWGDAWSTRWNPSLWAAQGWVVVGAEPERLDDVRAADGRSDLRRLGRTGDDRDRRGRCRGREDALRRQRAHGDRRRELRRLRGELDHRPAAGRSTRRR